MYIQCQNSFTVFIKTLLCCSFSESSPKRPLSSDIVFNAVCCHQPSVSQTTSYTKILDGSANSRLLGSMLRLRNSFRKFPVNGTVAFPTRNLQQHTSNPAVCSKLSTLHAQGPRSSADLVCPSGQTAGIRNFVDFMSNHRSTRAGVATACR